MKLSVALEQLLSAQAANGLGGNWLQLFEFCIGLTSI